MSKKNLALFFILLVVILFMFSPLFSKLLELFSSDKNFGQLKDEWRELGRKYWDAEDRFIDYLKGILPKR